MLLAFCLKGPLFNARHPLSNLKFDDRGECNQPQSYLFLDQQMVAPSEHPKSVNCSQHISCHAVHHVYARQQHRIILSVHIKRNGFLSGNGVYSDVLSHEQYTASYYFRMLDLAFLLNTMLLVFWFYPRQHLFDLCNTKNAF